MSESKGILSGALAKGAIAVLVGVAIYLFPAPTGLTDPKAWQLFAVFVATIVAFILQPLPMGAISIIALAFLSATGIFTIGEAMTGFSNSTIWLVVSAFLFSRAFINVGLGRRLSFILIHAIGSSPLKLAYALMLSDLAIAPATPSNTARIGGVLFPITTSLANTLKPETGNTNKIGGYLTQMVHHTDTACSAMFMTASASNTLAATLAITIYNIDISWGLWALAALVPGLICFFSLPWLMTKLSPPEITETPEAKKLARKELDALGPMTRNEKILIAVFSVMVVLWATATYTKLNVTTVALMGVSTLLITKVFSWKDAITESNAWDTLVWMGTLVTLATCLNKFGMVPWFAAYVSSHIEGMPWTMAFIILCMIYIYTHYFFASMTAKVTAFYPAFLAVAVAVGTPPFLAVLGLAFCTNISSTLTHYAQGPTPIFFGAGYVNQTTWWKNGFIVSVYQVIVWLGVGSVWWKVIGLW